MPDGAAYISRAAADVHSPLGSEAVMTGSEAVSTYNILRRAAEVLAEPIDFQSLAADGVLRERGGWYEVLDVARLPEHARVKIKAVRAPNLVKFRKPAGHLRRLLRRGH